jgi:hypothetical protein
MAYLVETGVATVEETEEGRRLEGPHVERHLLGRPHDMRCCSTLTIADTRTY